MFANVLTNQESDANFEDVRLQLLRIKVAESVHQKLLHLEVVWLFLVVGGT